MKALELGSVDVLCKPGSADSTQDGARNLVPAIRAAASVCMQKMVGKADMSAQKTQLSGFKLWTPHH